MLYFSIFTGICFFMYSAICIYVSYKFDNDDMDQNVVLVASLIYKIAVGCGIFFFVLAIYAEFINPTMFAYIFFIAFVWFTIGMMDRWLNSVILYNNESLQKGWLPWQKNYYKYIDITSIKIEDEKIKIYFGNKKINLDNVVMDGYGFVHYCSAKYKEIYGRDIPKNTSIPKWDIFKGHVKEPESFLILFIIVFILWLGLTGIFLYRWYDSANGQDITYIEAEITSYAIEDQHFVMESEKYDFVIFRYEEYGNKIQGIINALEKNSILCINAEEYEFDKNGVTKYAVCNIEDQSGTSLLSFEEINKNNKEYYYSFIPYILLLFIWLFLYFAGLVIVGRNPHKFSKRVQGIFFRDNYLK